jgi:hypothetical protein
VVAWWRRWFECDGGARRQESTSVPQAGDVRLALAAVRSSLSRPDHRRLTSSSLASTKILVFSSFTPRNSRSFFPNIRVNPFPQIHELSESPSYFVYISQHESPHSMPKLAGRSSPTSVSLSRTASRSSNENDTLMGIPIPESTRRTMATYSFLTPAMFASIVSIVYRTVFFEPSHHAAICGVT